MKNTSFIKRLLFIVAMMLSVQSMRAQNNICEYPDFFCKDTTFVYDYGAALPCSVTIYYWFHVSETIDSIVMSTPANITAYTCYGPFAQPTDPCDAMVIDPTPVVFSTGSGTPSTITDDDTIPPGYYYIKVTLHDCSSSISFDVFGELLCTPLPCENCIGSFAPEPGRKYILSLWVREENAPVTKTSFNKPEVSLIFTGAGTVTLGPFTATGQIIDGWQRLEAEFTVPVGATAMEIKLECDSASCFFDDIRIHPFDGSMKTYVFDPVTLRLVAELDERNYATFYEYDEEGKLVRIKKETERGVMTIQESKTSIKKSQ
ncbi:MAG TPA: hypothetical protein VK826_16575 [Bacteroidia bacterium]|nr:hypothetical protein [Bacteroidia bacterium]